jgi:hypothetical protein
MANPATCDNDVEKQKGARPRHPDLKPENRESDAFARIHALYAVVELLG